MEEAKPTKETLEGSLLRFLGFKYTDPERKEKLPTSNAPRRPIKGYYFLAVCAFVFFEITLFFPNLIFGRSDYNFLFFVFFFWAVNFCLNKMYFLKEFDWLMTKSSLVQAKVNLILFMFINTLLIRQSIDGLAILSMVMLLLFKYVVFLFHREDHSQAENKP